MNEAEARASTPTQHSRVLREHGIALGRMHGGGKRLKTEIAAYVLANRNINFCGPVNVLNPLTKFEDSQPRSIGDNFHRVECRIRLSILNPTQIRLIEATALSKLDLGPSPLQT